VQIRKRLLHHGSYLKLSNLSKGRFRRHLGLVLGKVHGLKRSSSLNLGLSRGKFVKSTVTVDFAGHCRVIEARGKSGPTHQKKESGKAPQELKERPFYDSQWPYLE
jgi:hypothetical protein